MLVHLKDCGAALLLAAGACSIAASCGGNISGIDSELFISGCLAVARNTCMAPAASAIFVSNGTLAGGLGRPYICAAQVENQNENGRVLLQTADIKVLDADGNVYVRNRFSPGLAAFTIPITGFVDEGDATNPGLGVSSVELIDSQTALDLGALALMKGPQTVQVQVLLHGQTVGGDQVETQKYFLYPVTVETGAECFQPPGEPCTGGTNEPTADCEIGQDETNGVDCRLLGASAATACGTLVCSNPELLTTATCPPAGTAADMSCCQAM